MKDRQCEMCMNYAYDEDYECMMCIIDMDEDEMSAYVERRSKGCPYYRPGDEYSIVRKQI